MNTDCTIVICSCDAYSDIWHPYFALFKRNWSNCPYPILLNTESKNFAVSKLNFRIIHAEEGQLDWSSRLIHALSCVNSEFVLLTLEDHFLLQPVDQERFSKLLDYMHRHPRIATMSFLAITRKKERLLNKVWVPIGNSAPLRINCSTALWRRDLLLSLLRPGENAWQFEGKATERAIWDTHKYYRYLGDPDKPAPILDFAQHVWRGYGVFQGKWLWNNQELFERNGIEVDLSVRGVLDEKTFYELRKQRLESNDANRDYRDQPGLVGDLYRHTPVWIRKLGSRIKRLFKQS